MLYYINLVGNNHSGKKALHPAKAVVAYDNNLAENRYDDNGNTLRPERGNLAFLYRFNSGRAYDVNLVGNRYPFLHAT